MSNEELLKEELNKQTNATAATANNGNIDRINQMYDAQKQSQLQQLESAYNQNLSNAQAAKDKIAPQYQQSANDLAVQYERNRRNFNQQAATSGINTGAASQAELSRSNEYLRDFGKLRSAESNALTEAERGITDLKTQYQNAISAATADNDYRKAAALLDEYNNQYNRDLAQAQQLAQFGDFSAYATLYGQGAADNMLAVWKAQNPDLAYNTGKMTAEEYKSMTGKYPVGYNAPSSGGGGYYYQPTLPTDDEDSVTDDGIYTKQQIAEALAAGKSLEVVKAAISSGRNPSAQGSNAENSKDALKQYADAVSISLARGNALNQKYGLT